MNIHHTAIIDKNADISSSAEIGPYVVVEANTKIGDGVRLMAGSYVAKYTEIGAGTVVHQGAVLGEIPQDHAFRDRESFLKIGKDNVIREHVTIHRGTQPGTSTIVGDHNYLMVNSHLGHNCVVGNNTIIANGALLAGYVTVENNAFISGNVVVHQFCRIGRLSIIGGFSGVNKDVPPFMSVRGPSVVWSINLVGIRRAKLPKEVIRGIKDAYNLIYLSGINTTQAIERIMGSGPCDEVKYLVDFIVNSKRGICKYRFQAEDKEYFQGAEEALN